MSQKHTCACSQHCTHMYMRDMATHQIMLYENTNACENSQMYEHKDIHKHMHIQMCTCTYTCVCVHAYASTSIYFSGPIS